MDLTDEQWALIQPHIPPPSPYARGRPPADPRATLNGILRKLRLAAPWYDLPPCASDRYPSWQTCYRCYHRWQRSGLMGEIYRLLYKDLRDRAGIDLSQDLRLEDAVAQGVTPAGSEGAIILSWCGTGWHLRIPPELEGTWQGSTILLMVRIFLGRLKQNLRTLTIEYS